MKGVAFKVTYNDGGTSGGGLIGFNGVCSNRTILENVKERGMTNCSEEGKPCREFFDHNFEGKRPSFKSPKDAWCYESTLFAGGRLRFGAGYYHNGPKTGEPIPISGVEAGDLALLTTLLPGTAQEDRIVFGCFRVARAPRFTPYWGNMVESDGTMDVKLPDDVAVQMNFWRYFQNRDGSKMWATGLFRYLDQDQTASFLSDLIGTLGDHEQRDVILGALGTQVKPRPVRRLPVVTGFSNGHGFGGGESQAHLNLKNFVAQNPASVGLPKKSVAMVEFPYLSGDQVDIKFDLPDGTAAVVEIETVHPLPGAHQCIKYRALLEAARGEPLGSGRVQAILVAHQFDIATRKFAAQYNIKLVQLQV